ncbi:nuclear factor of activated T-cells 5-like isoform X2 [Vespula maculifrons]|uniref:Nuclear factor of activated T-cells 5-like isoform X2 n=1 Tax=Vespula maculifrons TaxID=7453 RepID=A0ABD2CU04_VESMC
MLVKGRLWDRKNRRHHGKKSTKAAAGKKMMNITLWNELEKIRRAIGRFKRSHYVVRQVNVGQQQHLKDFVTVLEKLQANLELESRVH